VALVEVFVVEPVASFQGADAGCRGDKIELAQQPFPWPGVRAPVLPGGFDQELAGIGVPGLGDRALECAGPIVSIRHLKWASL
jgi:hypothetical protein